MGKAEGKMCSVTVKGPTLGGERGGRNVHLWLQSGGLFWVRKEGEGEMCRVTVRGPILGEETGGRNV